MTSLLDVWRAVDPEAHLVSGSVERLNQPARGLARTRAAPPHLPTIVDGDVLMTEATVLGRAGLDGFLRAIRDAGLAPSGVWLIGAEGGLPEAAADDLPVLTGGGSVAARFASATAYLDREGEHLAALAGDLRLAAAEAALADPEPGAPAGVLASRLRRGVAVAVEGHLAALNPRPAGRALASRFAAAHARLLAERSASAAPARRTRDGLWVLERPIASSAVVWLFDDLPFARVDEVGAEALAITLRALLRRRPAEPARARREPRLPPSTGDPMRDTLMAVARANGRIAPAARSLGVHRNTVLYRLRRASVELGVDPRRPEDALRLLRRSDD